ncbi:HAD family hydrolase [Paenibacillus albiflavus]|uniref:HAD family hydrolase n=1 Tax=Paenibacillus albiflavus TaxID=2545760 RepID=A0A4R4EEA6_9BACL|nr:HAD family hydrolase [Paenibacillus albiflavus]TCZ77410.1 HAD family hydrolase [Paenibacillus albiflavus]
MKRWISFDLDGTLMQNPFQKAVLPQVQAMILNHSEANYDVVKSLFHKHVCRLQAGLFVDAYDWDDIVQHEIIDRKLDLSINVEELVIQHSKAPYIRLLDETIVPALEQLRADGFSLAAVTNGFYKYQYPVLESLGIAQYFDEVVTPERCGSGKPDIRMLTSLRDTGEIVAHVGDRFEHDVYMAKHAGARAVFIDRSLSIDLRKLSCQERVKEASFQQLCEQRLLSELVNLESPHDLKLYFPDYVICDLLELVHIVKELTISS